MTICPIAVVAGCRKCPAFSVCPLKTLLGDAGKPPSGEGGKPAVDPGKDANPGGGRKK